LVLPQATAMDTLLATKVRNAPPELDRSILVLTPDEEAFLKSKTRIADTDKLKEHIFAVQEEAYKVFPFPCIWRFSFVGFKAARLPIYKYVLELGRERSDAIYLDVGCCVGNDLRKVIDDGYPIHNVIATDKTHGFWDIGHKLFFSTPESFPVKFIAGDIFDPAHLALVVDEDDNLTSTNPISSQPPESLQSLTSLNPLRGHVSVIYASAFFHLFDEERQFELARLFAGLLDPRPGSTMFGAHVALPEKGTRTDSLFRVNPGMFCHSPESWIEMWEDERVFGKGVVKVDARLHEVSRPARVIGTDKSKRFYLLIWSVVRL